MTELEWLTTSDARALFEHLRGPARSWPSRWFPWTRTQPSGISDRKAKLFVRAFARPALEQALDEPLREVIGPLLEWLNRTDRDETARTGASFINFVEIGMLGFVSIPALGPRCSDLLRELFGNPFRRARLDPDWLAWNAATVERLARAIYQEERFDELPLLADALTEAGCTDIQILDHLRQPSGHVCGCWALDLLLGKEG